VTELAATLEGDLAVVTHGLVCHALARRHLLLEPGVEVPLHFANTSVTVVDGTSPWRVATLNSAAHLEDSV
jgi:probable phosphoglycerate mutase